MNDWYNSTKKKRKSKFKIIIRGTVKKEHHSWKDLR